MAKTTIRKIMKVGGAVVGGLVVLVACYVALLCYPSILFKHHLEYKNITVHAQQELGEEMMRVLDEIEQALRTSDIYDPSLRHDIIFGHDNTVYRAIQGIKWKITYLLTGLEPALTYNEAALPYLSHIITFRIPDLPGNALLHPDDGSALDLRRVLTHVVVHSLLQARLGPEAVR